MITALVFIIIGLIVFHYYTHYGRRGRFINKIPGPKSIPIFGNTLQYNLPTDAMWLSQRKLNADFYPITKLWLADRPIVNVFHPDDVQILLTSTKHIEKNLLYDFLHPWLGTGLLTSSGKKWQHRRKMLTPAFHFNILQEFLDVFVEQAQELVHSLKSRGSDSVIEDVVPLFKKHTLKSICETAMGIPLNKLGNEDDYAAAIRDLGHNVFYRAPKPWFHSDWLFNLSPRGRLQQESLKTLHKFSTKIIKERKNYHAQKVNGKQNGTLMKNGHVEDDVGMHKKRQAMLDILISSARENGDIDDAGIREEVDTFVFEGHDTTAMGFIFTVALLAEYTEIQESARKEVIEIMNLTNGKLGMKEINSLSYLDRCIKEGLRLYPSVSNIGRKITEDLQLKNHLIPAGSMIHVHFFDLHRDPNYWPNPEVFDPDRFLPEVAQKRHPFAYVPFSAGPRNCIGQKFAMLELKTMIAYLLYHFDMEAIDLAHEVVLLQDLVITPAQPMRVKFTPRK